MSIEVIRYWNRREGREEIEQVYGDGILRWVYTSGIGQSLADGFLSGPTVSRLYGAYQNSGMSRGAIDGFIKRFGIKMEEYDSGPFHSFNDFFIRRFKPGMRIFTPADRALPAFAEGRYLAYESVTAEQGISVKGLTLAVSGLLGDRTVASSFEGGPLFVARLCPVDYHRFHFPDDGRTVREYRVGGRLHSVNPLALRYDPKIFVTNERHVSLLETKNFGLLAYVEVGALCVGKIVQTYDSSAAFRRGDEKGYFLFGASTVIVLGQPGKWRPDADLLERTRTGQETFVRLGEGIGETS